MEVKCWKVILLLSNRKNIRKSRKIDKGANIADLSDGW
jgi:hypothetical protein